MTPQRTSMDIRRWWTRATIAALALLILATPPAARAQEEEPAAEAPAAPAAPAPKAKAPKLNPATVATDDDDAPAAAPKAKAPKADAPAGSLAARVDKQAKELAQLKKDNDELKKQVRLLYLIVNKLAGLNPGQ